MLSATTHTPNQVWRFEFRILSLTHCILSVHLSVSVSHLLTIELLLVHRKFPLPALCHSFSQPLLLRVELERKVENHWHIATALAPWIYSQ